MQELQFYWDLVNQKNRWQALFTLSICKYNQPSKKWARAWVNCDSLLEWVFKAWFPLQLHDGGLDFIPNEDPDCGLVQKVK